MRFKDLQGQTLVELIAAAFVLAVGLVGVLALTSANVRNQSIGNNRLVASQLAREGVELARNIRDTNWMQEKEWKNGLQDPGGVAACAVIADTHDQFRFVSCSDQIVADTFILYHLGDRLMQLVSPSQEAEKTQYYRQIHIDPICVNKTEDDFTDGTLDGIEESINEGGIGCSALQIGIRVTSEVGWQAAGVSQSTKVVEQIYNWR